MTKGLENLSSGNATYRWLYSIGAKQPVWFQGAIAGRSAYEAWIAWLAKGFADTKFLLAFEAESNPWQRSRLVGERVSELRKSYKQLSKEEKAELAKRAESEMKTGISLLGQDKRLIQQLIEVSDPPEVH